MGQLAIKPQSLFLVGETVSAYLRSNWLTWQTPPSGAPQGAASGSGVVAADSSLLITGLPDDSKFFLYSPTPDRYERASNVGQTDVEIATGQGKTLLPAVVSAAGAGDNTIVAAIAGRQIKVASYVLVATGAVVATWKSGAASAISGAMSLAANGGISEPGEASSHVLETVAGQALVLNLGAAVQVSGHLMYFAE